MHYLTWSLSAASSNAQNVLVSHDPVCEIAGVGVHDLIASTLQYVAQLTTKMKKKSF